MKKSLLYVLLISALGSSIAANAYFLFRHFSALRPQPTFHQQTILSFDTVFFSEECKRFSQLPNPDCRLLFIGDSIPNSLVSNLESKRNEGDLEEPWISLFNAGIRNRCIAGCTTVGIDQLLDHLTLPQADEIILWLGANDMAMARNVPEIERNYREIMIKLRRAEPKARIRIVSVLPVCAGHQDNDPIGALNLRLIAIAKDASAEFIDVRPAVVDAAGNRDPASTGDGIHPNGPALTRIEMILARR